MNYKRYRLQSLIPILIILLGSEIVLSQPDTTWTKTFGGIEMDRGYSVQQTSDGGYIITGATSNFGSGGTDVWLIKTDASGTELWNKTLGGTDDEIGHAFQQTTDGGYIITGAIQYSENNKYDALLIKTDSNGAELWSKTFGGSERDYTFAVQQTTDGGFIISGLTRSFGNGQNLVNKDANDVWLIKTDSQGSEEWNKTFGGSEYESGYSVQQTTDGGYILTGWTTSFGNGGEDVWLIKTDSEGNTVPESEWK